MIITKAVTRPHNIYLYIAQRLHELHSDVLADNHDIHTMIDEYNIRYHKAIFIAKEVMGDYYRTIADVEDSIKLIEHMNINKKNLIAYATGKDIDMSSMNDDTINQAFDIYCMYKSKGGHFVSYFLKCLDKYLNKK